MKVEFRVGDLVTRDGSDVHRIVAMNEAGDLIEVECIKEPLGWLNDDGTRGEPWTTLGAREWNVPCRYEHAGDLIGSAGVKNSEKVIALPDLCYLPLIDDGHERLT